MLEAVCRTRGKENNKFRLTQTNTLTIPHHVEVLAHVLAETYRGNKEPRLNITIRLICIVKELEEIP